MNLHPVVKNVYAIPLTAVNAFLIDQDGLTLIDTGMANNTEKILAVVQELGRQPKDIKAILVTHLHRDHTGSLAALKAFTGAPVVMHPQDAALVRQGINARPSQPAPGLVNALVVKAFIGRPAMLAAGPTVEVEQEAQDGELLSWAGGIRAIHTPGHTAGHLAFLWPKQGGVLFAGDAVTNMFRMGYGPIYEDFRQGQESIRKLAALEFDTICFSHGKVIVGGAAARFRERWRSEMPK